MKQQSRKRWTKEEDKKLLKQVSVYPHNLKLSFMIVAEELNRTPAGVAAHWYNILSKKDDVIPYGLVSSKKIMFNRKSSKNNAFIANNTHSMWRKILDTLQNVF